MKYTTKKIKKDTSQKTGNKNITTVHITDEGKTKEQIFQEVIDEYNGVYSEDQKETYIPMKCKKCGFEEGVPDWLMAEFNEDAVALNQKHTMNTMICPECNGMMVKVSKNN